MSHDSRSNHVGPLFGPTLAAVLGWVIVLLASGGQSPAFAQPAAAQSEAAKQKAEAKARLGNWWQRNAATYDPIPSELLIHTEATISYQNLQGNTTGDVLSGNAQFVWRKKRLSNYWTYRQTWQDVVYGAQTGSVAIQRINLMPVLRYDLHKWLYVAGGAVTSRDDTFNLHNRRVGYAGVGTVYMPDPRHSLGLMGAIGYHDTEFAVPGANLSRSQRSTNGRAAYIEGNWMWVVDPKTMLSTTGNYLRYNQGEFLSGVRSEPGKSMDFNTSLAYNFSANVGLNLGYTVNREENIVVTVTKLKKTSRTFQFGIRFNY